MVLGIRSSPWRGELGMNCQRGFTLIEISIVLVVIGLIVGGILVGNQMIESSYIRNSAGMIEDLRAATNSFKLKYNFIPGDMKRPNNFGLSGSVYSPGAYYGDGNGIIEMYNAAVNDTYNQNQVHGEMGWYWFQLIETNLFQSNIQPASKWPTGCPGSITMWDGAGKDNFFPRLPLAGNYLSIYSKRSVNYFEISDINANLSCGMARYNSLTAVHAKLLDQKLDDGNPITGQVLATGGSIWYVGTAATPATNGCVNLANEYNGSVTGKLCSLQIRAGF